MRLLSAAILLIGLAAAVTAAPVVAAPDTSPRCAAAKQLLDDDVVDQAKRQYRKAVDEDPGEPCGVEGLKLVADAEAKAAKAAKAKADAEKAEAEAAPTAKEAVDAVGDAIAGVWPWIAGTLILLVLVWLFRAFGPARIALQSSKEDEEVLKQVLAAAEASGGAGALPAKLVLGPGEVLPEATVTAISSLLHLPGTAPLGSIFKLLASVPGVGSRLSVVAAAAGGWAVIDLDLRLQWGGKRTARIALPAAGMDEKQQNEMLGLVGGAWLLAQLGAGYDGSPIVAGSAEAAVYHACFRAGATSHARGEWEIARSCYAAMPVTGVGFAEAPFAWLGARLNEMMALTNEGRWGEAARFADAVEKYPVAIPEAVATYAPADLADLLRRRRYMTAVMRVEHFFALAQQGVPEAEPRRVAALDAAQAAVDELAPEMAGGQSDSPDTTALRGAIRMVALCFAIARGEGSMEEVETLLAVPGQTVRAAQPLLGAAAYYDAACAVSMLMARQPRYSFARKPLLARGLELIETAVAAAGASRLKVVQANAKADDMLKPLRDADEDGFLAALGVEAPASAPA